MRGNQISVGDTLKLKNNNRYGLEPQPVTVTALLYKPGYKTPYVLLAEFRAPYNAFRPADLTH